MKRLIWKLEPDLRGPMYTGPRWRLGVPLFFAAMFAMPVLAQQQPVQQPAPAPAKPSTPSAPESAAKPPAKHKHAAKPATAAAGGAQPTLLGQYGEWGAYTASPNGKKICFALAKPSSSQTEPPNRPRNPSYMFISTRPTEKVSNEVSVNVGYAFKPNSEATAEVGSTAFALYTQQDGAWNKNAAEDARMIGAMRTAASAVVKGVSAKGTRSTDTFSLKGFAQAVDRSDQECK